MSSKALTPLLIGALAAFILGCLVFALFINTQDGSGGEQEGEGRGTGNYAPSYNVGTLVSVDEEQYLVYIEFDEISIDGEVSAQRVCFSLAQSSGQDWEWLTGSAKPGDSVGVSYHPFSLEQLSEGPLDALSVTLVEQ